MKELSEKSYWDGVHRDKSIIVKNLVKIPFIEWFLIGFHNWQFYSYVKKYHKKSYKNIFEVGCAPGNYLLQFASKFYLIPSGIEYSSDGVEATKKNFEKTDIVPEIIFGDFFDDSVLASKKEYYDIVYSVGFIEHFDDTHDVIARHFSLLKEGGLLVITIPNLSKWNQLFVPKDIIDIHNTSIMNIDRLRQIFAPFGETLEIRPIGGIFNAGAFAYKNNFLEKLRLLIFIFQRVFLDPMYILLAKVGIDLSNSYTSPTLIVITRKSSS